MIAGGRAGCFDLLSARRRCATACRTTRAFRERMTAAGFDIKPGVHPIVPVMMGDAALAQPHGRAPAGAKAST
jgi:glycine C-acetyltransferase